MVEKKKGDYQYLNIENVYGFKGMQKYTKSGAYTLQEIDMFTMMFNNEEELRNALVSFSVLPSYLADKSLSIRWVNKGMYNKVPYDFLYKDDLYYISNPYKLIDYVMNRFFQWDFVFIRKLADYFSSHRECSSTAIDVRMCADMSIRDNSCCRYLNDVDLNGDYLVKRLVKLLLFEHDVNINGRINYKDKVNYRNLHMMIAFINNYKKKTEGVVKTKPSAKVKIKNKENLEQISIFDVMPDLK